MIQAEEKYARLQRYFQKLNEAKKRKRVADARLQATQYVAHVLPTITQRILLAPFYRAVLAVQTRDSYFSKSIGITQYTSFGVVRGTLCNNYT